MSKFQAAATAVVDGDLDGLRHLLGIRPTLVTDRSPVHGASLLHYVSANGPVEDEMQRTPANAVEIARTLIASGCEVDATIAGEASSTPLVGLVTSYFPAKAGLQRELTELFVQSGASVDGLEDDGYPLSCALAFHYVDAVEALVACAARVDNIVAAAALGRMDFLLGCFDEEGNVLPGVSEAYSDPFKRKLPPGDILQIAYKHANDYQQIEAINFLASKLG